MSTNNTKIPHHAELYGQIVDVAMKAFRREGIKNVTMDEIAHGLTMSKRTLYQIFSNKEELLLACVKKKEAEERVLHAECWERTGNVMPFLLETFAAQMNEMDDINPCFFTDIVKYPALDRYFKEQNRLREAESVAFLNKGKEQGYFRPDVNFHIVYNQVNCGLKTLLTNEEMNKYSRRELFVNTVIPYLRGCSTMKGIEMIDRFIEEYKA